MKSQSKNDLLDMLEGKVEAHISETVKIFQNLPEAELCRPSDTNGWSIAQCLEHLNSYSHYYLPHLRAVMEKPRGENGPPVFTSGWLGSYFTRLMDPNQGKRKMKAFNAHIPSADLDAYAVVAEFILHQEEMLQLIRAARKADLNTRIPISISKWIRLKAGDVLQFVIAHDERHILQAKRNLPPSLKS
ncbi:MAG: DinB family protein [Cytophagaceae bacterium]